MLAICRPTGYSALTPPFVPLAASPSAWGFFKRVRLKTSKEV